MPDDTSDKVVVGVLGCHVIGSEAGELIHEVVVAMAANAAGGVHRPSQD